VNTFGVFQTYYQTSLLESHSASEISWIGTFQAFLLVAFSLVAGPIFDRGYFRPLIIVGTFLIVFGTMMTSISENYWQVFLSQGLCVGLGAGCIFLPSVAIVATYFTTKRALAIGIVASGGSIGSVIYPIVFYRLLSEVGFPWATRVLGFIALGTLSVSIAVLRSRLPPAKVARSMLDLKAFKNAPFSLFTAGLFLSFAGLYVPIFYIIIYAEKHLHIGPDLSFYFLPILNAASVFGRILPGLWADRFGSLELIIICTFLAAIFAYIGIVVVNLGGLIVFAILYGFVSGAVVSLPSAVVASLAPSMNLVGTWMGMSFCFAGVGILIGNPIAGTIINVPLNEFTGGFIFAGSTVMVAALCYAAAKWGNVVEKLRHGRK
jgi:MFS family permease